MSPYKYIKEMIIALKALGANEFEVNYIDTRAYMIELIYRESDGQFKYSLIKDIRTTSQRRKTVERLHRFIANL